MGINEFAALLFLGGTAGLDIWKRQIYIPVIIAGGSLGLLIKIYLGEGELPAVLLSLIPGFCLLVIGRGSHQAVGYGDGFVVLIMGIYFGLWKTAQILLNGLLISSVWAAGLIIIRKKGKKQEFPFIPFLFIGALGIILTGGTG